MKNLAEKLIAVMGAIGGLTVAQMARAEDLSRTNPVTGAPQTFMYYYAGSSADATNAADWNTADGEHPENYPGKGGIGPYAPFMVDGTLADAEVGEDGLKAVQLGTLEGWSLQVGLFNGVNVNLGAPKKIQGPEAFLMVDGSSKGTFDYDNGTSVGTIDLYLAGELTFSRFTKNSTANYYLTGKGNVIFTAAPTAGTHNLKRADFALSQTAAYQTLTKKYLATGVGSRAFILTGASITAKDSSGSTIATTEKSVLTSASEIGDYQLGQDSEGVYVMYVDYTDKEPALNVPTLILEGETTDFSIAANWVSERAPQAGEDALVIVNADTTLSASTAISLGKLTVTGSGALNVRTSNSQKISVGELVVDTDIAFQPATLGPEIVTISAGKTAAYYMYADATLSGIRGTGVFEVYAGTEETGRTLTLTKNASIGATASDVTIKLHHGTIHLPNTNGDCLLNDVRFDLDAGTAITQFGWVRVIKGVEIFVDADKSASAFTQSKVHNEGENAVFKKTGAGTLEINAALCTQTAAVEAGALVIGSSNGADNTATFSSVAAARVIKKGDDTTGTITGQVTLEGGLEVEANGGLTLSAPGTIAGVKGSGVLSIGAAVYLKNNATWGYSLGDGVVVNLNNGATLGLGNSATGVTGGPIGDCTLNFNGGNMTAYGWIDVGGTVIANVTAETGVLTGNANNHTRPLNDSKTAKLVKRGSGTLQWKSNIILPVTIEDGTLDKKTDASFTIEGAIAVELAGVDAKLLVPETQKMTNVTSTIENYRVIRTVAESAAIYSLEKRNGFWVIIK